MRLKVSSAKRRPFCLGLNVLNLSSPHQHYYNHITTWPSSSFVVTIFDTSTHSSSITVTQFIGLPLHIDWHSSPMLKNTITIFIYHCHQKHRHCHLLHDQHIARWKAIYAKYRNHGSNCWLFWTQLKEIMEISRQINSSVASYTSDIFIYHPYLYLSQLLVVSSSINACNVLICLVYCTIIGSTPPTKQSVVFIHVYRGPHHRKFQWPIS